MRRIVRNRVAASIEQAKPQLEDYVAQRLQYPEAFPYVLNEPVISIRELHKLRIEPLIKADYPPLDIEADLRASLAGCVRNVPGDPCPRVFDIDVLLKARATVRGDGTYEIAPHSATLKAWWGGISPNMASGRRPPRLAELKRALRWLRAQYQRRAEEAASGRDRAIQQIKKVKNQVEMNELQAISWLRL